MAKVALYNMDGKECGQIELKDEIFNVEVNTVVMHEVVVAHLANRRQGTQSAKTRAEVRAVEESRTVRRERDELVREVSVLPSGSAAVSFSRPNREIIPRRSTRRFAGSP